jgi:deazaflavin-dependent oxidoreductase (nitroreductase family)
MPTSRPRSTPLYYLRRGGHYYVVAGFAGSNRPPRWFTNLVAEPAVTVAVGSARTACRARVLPSEETRSIWPLLVRLYPPFGRYQARTTRRIPVVELTPRMSSLPGAPGGDAPGR